MITLTKKDELSCEKVILVLESDPQKQKVIDEFD